jgi:hypothetical protein
VFDFLQHLLAMMSRTAFILRHHFIERHGFVFHEVSTDYPNVRKLYFTTDRNPWMGQVWFISSAKYLAVPAHVNFRQLHLPRGFRLSDFSYLMFQPLRPFAIVS